METLICLKCNEVFTVPDEKIFEVCVECPNCGMLVNAE